ncbi:hypothetical protein F5I97DRAFT_1863705 [Phlebopus sp. FC_14]|nr:hypothetical protein F5I97DRAFT_1863705 [Phlebopus sp. FC_14]
MSTFLRLLSPTMDNTREYDGLQLHEHPALDSLARLSSMYKSWEGEYLSHIKELTTSQNAFRTAYTASQDQLKEKNEETIKLIAELQALKGLEKRVVCLLDGDGSIFSADLMNRGQEGGLEAARMLTEKIHQHLSFEHGYEQYQLWVYLFYNKRGLLETLNRVGLATVKQFEEFTMGFNQAAERFAMVDVGGSKEAADAKIKVHLQDNIRLPQTYKIIFGGSHDNGYVNVLRSVITAGFREKLILMPGYTDVAMDIRLLMLPELRIPDLFMATKLVAPSYMSIASGSPPGLPATPKRAPAIAQVSSPNLGHGDGPGSIARRDSIPTYKSVLQTTASYEPSDSSASTDAGDARPVQFTRRVSSPGKQRHVNPKLALSKQNPAPCTLFYLTDSCRHGSDCKYAHDYLLEAEHYQELRENAKKTPCKVTNDGGLCTFGDNCVYGHVCPNGSTCYFLKLGKCKFQAVGMHR